jgi:nickel-type superoxide dismutase maturation protease
MYPLLKPDDLIMVNPYAYQNKQPQAGDLVIATHPTEPNLKIVKRLAYLTEDGNCFLAKENPHEGTDSHSFGLVPLRLILGKVTGRFPK